MPPQDIAVRHADERDVPALRELLQLYFAEGEVQHVDTEADLLSQVRTPLLGFYLAESHEGLAGCVMSRVLDRSAGTAECKRLYVRPEFRRCGVAGRLMEAVEAEASKADFTWMYLDSKDSFDAALAMYKRRGYAECPRYNDNLEAAFFFRKRLR